MEEWNVWDEVPISECWAETGKAPIPMRWIDINTGAQEDPNYKSRLVAKEYKTDVSTLPLLLASI